MENPTLGRGPLNIRKSEICRLCLKTHEYYLNIFVSNEEFKTSIGKAIEDLLVLKVSKGDNLPKMVCCPCVTKLMEFRDFKVMCMNSAREFGRDAPVEPVTCPVKDEFLPLPLFGEAMSGTWSNCVYGESLMPLAPNELTLDPFALENQNVKKELYPRDPLEESDHCGEEDFAETECNEDAGWRRPLMEAILVSYVCPVKDEFLPMQLLGEGTNGTWSNSVDGESGVPVVPNDSLLDPFALENQADTKEVYPRDPLGEFDECGEEDFAETEFNEDAAVCSESKQHLMGDQGEVKEELKLTELVGKGDSHSNGIFDVGDSYDTGSLILMCDSVAVMNMIDIKVDDDIKMGDCSLNIEVRREVSLLENEGSGKECSGGGAPLSETKPENQVDCCNYIGGIPEVSEFNVDKLTCGRLENSQPQLASNSSYDHMREENLQFEYSPANSLAAHTYSRKISKKKEKITLSDSNKICSLSNDLKYLQCDTCGKSFKCSSDLKKHSVIHTVEKQHRCDMCGKTFTQKRYLKRHSFVHTVVKQHRCNMCGKTFTEKHHLKRHSFVHTREKPFKCDVCGKGFTEKSGIKRHLPIHTGVKPYKCTVCGKIFTQIGSLKNHSVIHNSVKIFKCDDCGNMFTRKDSLAKHLGIHAGEKPFKCIVCGKNFTAKSSLKTHSVIHTGDKPYKCAVCGKMFTQRGSLKTHSKIHTVVKPFKCDI